MQLLFLELMNNFVNLNVYLYENTIKNFILMEQTSIYLKKYLKKNRKKYCKGPVIMVLYKSK